MSEVIRLRKEYRKILKNFAENEFERSFVHIFGAEKWNEVLKNFKNKRICTKKDADRAVAITVETFDKTYLRNVLFELQLLDVLLHSKRKKWYAVQLCGDRTKTSISEKKLEDGIKSATVNLKAPYDVHIRAHKEIFWIRMSPKSHRGSSPMYFAYFVYEDIILTTKKRPNKKVLKAIVSTLRCEKYKNLNLEGNDVWSLLRMVKQKGGIAVEMDTNVRLIGNEENHQELFVDHTKKSERRAEAENCFGKDPPILQSLVIKCQSGFRARNWIHAVEGVPSTTIMRLKHQNMAKYLKELAVSNVIIDPEFYKSILITGKNVITLKDPSLK